MSDKSSKKKSGDSIKRLLRSRLLILIIILLFFIIGVLIVNRGTQDPAAKLPRQLADQLLQGWQSCNFDTYMRAKSHALYKDSKEKIESGPDKQKFDETCGKIQVLDLMDTEKSAARASEGTVGYRFDYKLKQSMSNEWNEVVVLSIIVVGDEKEGFLISILPFVNEGDYTHSRDKSRP